LGAPPRSFHHARARSALHSAAVATYGEADVSVARRIADYVTIAISHQRMAEEGRRAASLPRG